MFCSECGGDMEQTTHGEIRTTAGAHRGVHMEFVCTICDSEGNIKVEEDAPAMMELDSVRMGRIKSS